MQNACSNISRKSVHTLFRNGVFENIEQAKTTIQTFKNRHYEEGSVFRWGNREKGTGQLIGNVGGFHLIIIDHKRAEIVCYELDDTYWDKGYATKRNRQF